MNREKMYFSIIFFINMSLDKKRGNAIVALVRKRESLTQAKKDVSSNHFLIIKKETDFLSSYSFITYTKSNEKEIFNIDSFMEEEAYIYAAPLRDNIWKLSQEEQDRVLDQTKTAVYGDILSKKVLPICDMPRLDVLMEQYCHKEDREGRKFFIQEKGKVLIEKSK